MKLLAAFLSAAALSGCASSDFDLANQACRDTVDVPTWDQCIEAFNAKIAARDAQRRSETSGDNGAAVLLQGATALVNGFNQGRGYNQPKPMVSTSCTTTNGITNCLSY